MTISMKKNAEFYIVDFDRTLADSDKLTEVFVEVCEEYNAISREQISKADTDMKRLGDSFDTAGYVRDHLNNSGRGAEWDLLEKKYIHESKSLNMLLSGAAELLHWLDSHQKDYGILTYGNPLWQRMKLSATGFNRVPHIVLERKDKGSLISSWQRKDGSFELPHELGGGIAERIVMLDDKAISFENFPPRPSKGYWVLNPQQELPSQQGSVPENVERCNDLHDALEQLEV